MSNTILKAAAAAAVLFVLTAPVTAQTPGQQQLFDVAGTCMACHNGITSPAGMDLSFGTSWRPSMMANSARDPYWQAAVKRETMDHPGAAVAIQDECSKCHMPMARFQAHTAGQPFEFFGELPWQPGQGMAPQVRALAHDGVSCTLCHQIEAEGLGSRETFVGAFNVDTGTPMGQRSVYGPYEITAGASRAMLTSGQFLPTQSEHVREAGLCASCHTLFTHARNDAGEVIGELPEQVPYLEWLHSDYRDEQSCQSCHMPKVDGQTAISSVLPIPRPDVRRHVFRGGNFFVPRIFNLYGAELAVAALPGELDAMVGATERFLSERTARVEVGEAVHEDGRLAFDVRVTNLAGHKLPTAYPSRRAWLHVTVMDAAGGTVFESGALRADGSIVGNDNDADAAAYEPHHTAIEAPDDVQIYEAIMADYRGDVTTGLVYGVEFVKDSRLLPRGFDKTTAGPDIAVRGGAANDGDFTAAGDHVRYAADVGDRAGPFTVKVALRYQPIAFRWARNLGEYDAPEPNRFVRFYDSLAHVSGAILAEAVARIE
ncbi:MAG: hypothetical protein R6U63_00700 [Longimicrobiales bacterium]